MCTIAFQRILHYIFIKKNIKKDKNLQNDQTADEVTLA